MLKKLTPREQQIVDLIQWGATQKMVANALGISSFTVNTIMRNIYQKLECDSTDLRKLYLIDVLNVAPELCPLERYNFLPQVSNKMKVTALLLFFLTSTQLLFDSNSLIRTFRQTSSRTAKVCSSARRVSKNEIFTLEHLTA